MPNRQYEAGRRFEYRVVKDLTKRGYKAKRTPGSKGVYDIHAIGAGYSLFVQVKSGKDDANSSREGMEHAGWNKLLDHTSVVYAYLPVVADRDGRKIRYRLITGYHTYRSRDWPAEMYEP
jgi:hypothetical protein